MPHTKTCPVCGKTFTCRDLRKIYCSRQCFHQQRSADLQAKVNHAIHTCPVCGQSFSDPKHPNRVYCSRDCMGMSKRNRVTKICVGCGKAFDIPECQSHFTHCTKECQRNRVTKTCVICGKLYSVRATRSEDSRYCSSECYAIDWVDRVRNRMRMNGPTLPEKKTQDALDIIGIPYELEKRFKTYLVDFFLPGQSICLEVDGDYWHSLPGKPEKDDKKDQFLRSLVYKVIRISESDINNAECVTTLVAQRLGL